MGKCHTPPIHPSTQRSRGLSGRHSRSNCQGFEAPPLCVWTRGQSNQSRWLWVHIDGQGLKSILASSALITTLSHFVRLIGLLITTVTQSTSHTTTLIDTVVTTGRCRTKCCVVWVSGEPVFVATFHCGGLFGMFRIV